MEGNCESLWCLFFLIIFFFKNVRGGEMGRSGGKLFEAVVQDPELVTIDATPSSAENFEQLRALYGNFGQLRALYGCPEVISGHQ